MAQEKPGQTLQATALVHEAYLGLVGNGRGGNGKATDISSAAAEAMRLILINRARDKARLKHGGGLQPDRPRPGRVRVRRPTASTCSPSTRR